MSRLAELLDDVAERKAAAVGVRPHEPYPLDDAVGTEHIAAALVGFDLTPAEVREFIEASIARIIERQAADGNADNALPDALFDALLLGLFAERRRAR